MQVKAKFSCNSILNFQHGKTAKLNAIYGKEGENADFTKATPNGSIEISISEETPAVDYFQPGKNYYVYFEEVSE
jgi:hypothetical protein